jgi:hypothetical protein
MSQGTTQEVGRRKIMKYRVFLCVICIISANFLASCASQELQEVQNELRSSATSLPKLANADVLQVSQKEWSYTAYGDTCFYGRAWVLIGSSELSEEQMLTNYVERLTASGWNSREQQYSNSKVLYRGMHELIVISVGEPAPAVRESVDYKRFTRNYPNVIFARLTYMLPQREGC